MSIAEIEFSVEELDRILEFWESIEAETETVQEAITKAIDLATRRVDVVRCKDCKHWVPGYITDSDDFIPPRCMDNHGVGWHADDFCCYGSKQEEKDVSETT